MNKQTLESLPTCSIPMLLRFSFLESRVTKSVLTWMLPWLSPRSVSYQCTNVKQINADGVRHDMNRWKREDQNEFYLLHHRSIAFQVTYLHIKRSTVGGDGKQLLFRWPQVTFLGDFFSVGWMRVGIHPIHTFICAMGERKRLEERDQISWLSQCERKTNRSQRQSTINAVIAILSTKYWRTLLACRMKPRAFSPYLTKAVF